jgi:hypothetical protein
MQGGSWRGLTALRHAIFQFDKVAQVEFIAIFCLSSPNRSRFGINMGESGLVSK